jgi:cell division inhibitor SepF
MPGAMRKMGVYLGLVEDDPYGEYGEPASDRAHLEEPEPVDRRYADRGGYAEPEYDAYAEQRQTYAPERPPVRAPRRDVEPRAELRPELREARAVDMGAEPYRITTLHPRTYNEARTIGEHFRAGVPVIMNLTDMDDSDAKRLVDFSAGLTFGLRGRIERVTAKVFLLSPENVTVTAEDKARMVEGAFFNQS